MSEPKEIEFEYSRLVVPFGPIHPALKEPVHFKVTVRGEEILDVDLVLGHAHRGIELLAQERNILQNLYLTERICGICSHTHTTCYAQAIEEVKGIQIPERAAYLRALIFELERVHSHLLLLGVMAYEIGYDTLFMQIWNMREAVLDLFEEVTGNRVHHSMNVIGGVRWDLTPVMALRVSRVADGVEDAQRRIRTAFMDRTVKKRLVGVGVMSRADARASCLVGPTARASGLTMDVRKDDPYAAYSELKDDYSVVVSDGMDAMARVDVRVRELAESVNIIRAILGRLPPGEIRLKESPMRAVKVPEGEAVSRVEAPRGELIYYLRTDGNEGLRRLKVRTPSQANFAGIRQMMVGGELADVPVILASIDPCMSCTNRLTVVDEGAGRQMNVGLDELRRRRASTS